MKKQVVQARANDSGPSPETQAQIGSNPVKSAGHSTADNEWFNIGLSPVEVAILKNIQARIFIDPLETTRAQTIRVLLLGALAHYDALAGVLFRDAEYCRNEGFAEYEAFYGKMIEAKLEGSGAGLTAIRDACKARRTTPATAGKRPAKPALRKVASAIPSAAKTGLPDKLAFHGMHRMEDEIYAVAGLVDMLSRSLAEFQDENGNQMTKQAAVGTLELANRTMARLWDSYHAAWDYYNSLPGQPNAGAGAGSAEAGEGGAK